MSKFNEYFYGNKVSDYGIENGYVDYSTLARSFDAILNNDIISKTYEIGYWEQVNGFAEAGQDDDPEIFQYYIISDDGADILKRETNEIVYYNEELNMYVWGVTHWGTRWDYVLTDIALTKKED